MTFRIFYYICDNLICRISLHYFNIQTLQRLDKANTASKQEGLKPCNKTKNRYKNILPCKFIFATFPNSKPLISSSSSSAFLPGMLILNDNRVFNVIWKLCMVLGALISVLFLSSLAFKSFPCWLWRHHDILLLFSCYHVIPCDQCVCNARRQLFDSALPSLYCLFPNIPSWQKSFQIPFYF